MPRDGDEIQGNKRHFWDDVGEGERVDLDVLRNERKNKKKRKQNTRDVEALDLEAQVEKVAVPPMPEKVAEQPQVEIKAERIEINGDEINRIEDILLVLKYVPAGAIEKNKGQSWFDALLDRKMKAVERIKQRGGRVSDLIRSDGNFSKENSEELINGIFYLGSAELRETRPDDWKEIEECLVNKYGVDTEKIIPELSNLYTEGKEAEVSLLRIISDNKLAGLVEPLRLIRGYMESGQYPKGWGEAKRVFEETGIRVSSYERMREMEKKKKELDEAIFGKRETPELAENKIESEGIMAEDVVIEKDDEVEKRDTVLNWLTSFSISQDEEEKEVYLSALEESGVKIKQFLKDMEKAAPGRSVDVARHLRAVVEIWRMDETKRREFPTMTKIASNYARVLGLE